MTDALLDASGYSLYAMQGAAAAAAAAAGAGVDDLPLERERSSAICARYGTAEMRSVTCDV